MKKLLLSALAVCAFTFSNAQEETKEVTGEGFAKGDIMVSGTLGFNSTSNVGGTKDSDASGFHFNPRAAYFLTDNIAAGVKFGYANNKTEVGSFDVSDNQTLTAGLFGRYYFSPVAKFSVFGELGFDYIAMENKLALLNGKSTGFGVGAGVGANYFVSKCLALELNWGALSYDSMKNEASGAETESNFGLNLDLNDISLGLVVRF